MRFQRQNAIPKTTGEEWLSVAYLRAICAQAGLNIQSWDFDNGIDLSVGTIRPIGGVANATISMQLKATQNWEVSKDGYIKYDLPVKNYNLLRCNSIQPQYLVLFTLPQDGNLWVKYRWDDLEYKHVIELRHMAYYLNLKGSPETDNTETIRINIPVTNKLTTKELVTMFRSYVDEWIQNQEGTN